MIRNTSDGVEIDVLVAPRASRNKIGPIHDDRIKLAVTAPPIDGAANDAVIELLAKTLGVAKSSVLVVRGQTSKRKTVLVRGAELASVRELLPAAVELGR